MKKINMKILAGTTAIAFLAIAHQPLAAQCETMPINPTAIIISSNQTIDESISDGNQIWVCEGVTLTVTGSVGNQFLLEENVNLIFNGTDGDDVYAKANCSVTNNSDQEIVVTTVASTTTSNGGNIVRFNCSTINYDYSFAPASNCVTTTGVDENNVSSIVVSTEEDAITIQSPNTEIEEVWVYSTDGRLLLHKDSGDRTKIANPDSASLKVVRIKLAGGAELSKLVH